MARLSWLVASFDGPGASWNSRAVAQIVTVELISSLRLVLESWLFFKAVCELCVGCGVRLQCVQTRLLILCGYWLM